MRKEQVPPELEKKGYHDYTSAALHTRARSSYGYYEVKARPMNSGGSSSFWFQQEDRAELPGWSTEIDVFEFCGKSSVPRAAALHDPPRVRDAGGKTALAGRVSYWEAPRAASRRTFTFMASSGGRMSCVGISMASWCERSKTRTGISRCSLSLTVKPCPSGSACPVTRISLPPLLSIMSAPGKRMGEAGLLGAGMTPLLYSRPEPKCLPRISAMMVKKMISSYSSAGTAIFLAWTAMAASAATVNAIRAVVHDAVITQQDVQQMTAQGVPVLRAQYPGQDDVVEKKLADAEGENLEQLAQRQLILHEFKTSGFNLPESILDDLVQERIHSRYGNRRTLTKSLQAEGSNFERFKERLREQFIVEAMRNKYISSEIIISPQKVENYYQAHKEQFKVEDQLKLRMIVLNKSTQSGAPEARKLAEELFLKVREGTPFSELAAIYSQRSQRDNSGEWFEKSQLRKEFAEATTSLKPGEISTVVETPEACYLVQVEEIRPEHYKPLPEARTTIESNLTLEERARLEKQWVERLKKKTFVRYY